MNQEEIKTAINNKQLEVKNIVFLNKEKIEKLEKYKFSKINIILLIITISLGIFNYFNNFIGLPFIIFVISLLIFLVSIMCSMYIKVTINKLSNQIKNLELYFKELESKKMQ